eukprot:2970682-Rhodomonas_salina.1
MPSADRGEWALQYVPSIHGKRPYCAGRKLITAPELVTLLKQEAKDELQKQVDLVMCSAMWQRRASLDGKVYTDLPKGTDLVGYCFVLDLDVLDTYTATDGSTWTRAGTKESIKNAATRLEDCPIGNLLEQCPPFAAVVEAARVIRDV